MIYLIDDTELNNFGVKFLEEVPYNSFVKIISTESQYKSLKDLESADCIFVHRTFGNNNRIKEEVSQISDDGDKIPLVIFSAGDSNVANYDAKESPNWILGINKSIFYSRIKSFLDKYISNKTIDISEIAYGQRKSFHDIKTPCLSILKILEDTNLSQSNIIQILNNEIFEEIIKAANPLLMISHEQIISEFKDKKISLMDLKLNIISILISFEKYGKNIYPWK